MWINKVRVSFEARPMDNKEKKKERSWKGIRRNGPFGLFKGRVAVKRYRSAVFSVQVSRGLAKR